MALPDIQIDDRTFDQLFAVLRKQIPADYTDHNPSDPLIALLELFCWLGEMELYRMNRKPPEHEEKYLDLLIDPPVPVTAPLTFTVTFAAPPAQLVLIPTGTRVATDFHGGRRFVFETLEDATVPDAPDLTRTVTVTAREHLAVSHEVLGASDGTPRQSFRLSPLRGDLGLAADDPAPLLVDYETRSIDYRPNPQVRAYGGFLNGTGGAVSPASGFLEFRWGGAPEHAHFFLTYSTTPPELTLTRGGGPAETVALEAGPIAEGETERVDFPAFPARVVLTHAFDKAIPMGMGTNTAAVTGSGTIDSGSIEIVSTVGSIAAITSDSLTIGNLTEPANLGLSAIEGFAGTFDGSSAGGRVVELSDGRGNSLTIAFEVTAAFDGGESAATIQLGQLGSLVVAGGELWEAQHSLLTEKSKVDPADPRGPRHFRVEPGPRRLHFGDGVFGAIPPSGFQIVCERYQLLQGPAALIEAGEVRHLLTPIPGLADGDAVAVTNEDDAVGGVGFFAAGKRLAAGLEGFRRPYRLVTADDFERLLVDDFNAFQELAGRPERVARAVATMNRRPPLDVAGEAPGHVTVTVLSRLEAADQAVWDDPATSLAAKEALLALGAGEPLERRVLGFLDQRRLITTRVHVAAPSLAGVDVAVRFVVEGHRNTAAMEQAVGDAVLGFLDLLAGGFDGKGWAPGRNVYRSEILRLIEGLDGVDHVESLDLTPAGAGGDVAVGEHELPVVGTLSVSALRR